MKFFKRKSTKTARQTNSLKANFGAFAMSQKEVQKIKGGGCADCAKETCITADYPPCFD